MTQVRHSVRVGWSQFGPGDLALDAVGAQQVFSAAQVSLAPGLAAAVAERTEGWPAGLHLAALIAKDSHADALAITGDDRYVADYLYRETLVRQPEDVEVPVAHGRARSVLCPGV
jgi:LuxR family transcriptional regulator, maltose regulon positive regulatory protein